MSVYDNKTAIKGLFQTKRLPTQGNQVAAAPVVDSGNTNFTAGNQNDGNSR